MNLKNFWLLTGKVLPPFKVIFKNGIHLPITITSITVHVNENVLMYHQESGEWFQASTLENIDAIETIEEET